MTLPPKRPITRLGNIKIPDAQSVNERILALDYPKLVNPKLRRGKLQEEPYWESYAPITNFYALVAEPFQLPEFLDTLLQQFALMCEPYVPEPDRKFAHLLITESSVEAHRDPPVRDYGINWYPFPPLNHTLTVGDTSLCPKQGDFYLLDVREYHETIQRNQPLPFFSYTIFQPK